MLSGLLLAKGAKVNAINKAGKTALAIALKRRPRVIAVLRKHGGK